MTQRGLGLKSGEEVITAPNSFLASASAIALAGGTIRFADVGDDYNLDPLDLERRITVKTKGIIVVHLTGRPAKMDQILKIADKHGLFIIEDCAQAIGAEYNDRKVGTLGDTGCFSLHPLKNLNAAGDGGMITTRNSDLADWFKKARNHGLIDRDTCEFWSYNTRLDALQAAMLSEKIKQLDEWTLRRRDNAKFYIEELKDIDDIVIPVENDEIYSVYHLFMVQCSKRDELLEYLCSNGIDAKVHYPIPIHLQPAANSLGYKQGDFPECEKQTRRIISLPIHQYLEKEQLEYVVSTIRSFFGL